MAPVLSKESWLGTFQGDTVMGSAFRRQQVLEQGVKWLETAHSKRSCQGKVTSAWKLLLYPADTVCNVEGDYNSPHKEEAPSDTSKTNHPGAPAPFCLRGQIRQEVHSLSQCTLFIFSF